MGPRATAIQAVYEALQSNPRLNTLLGHNPGATTYPEAKIIGEALRVDVSLPLIQIGVGLEEATASPKRGGDRRMQIYLTVYAATVYELADIFDEIENAVQEYPSAPSQAIARIQWGGAEGMDTDTSIITGRALVIVQWVDR